MKKKFSSVLPVLIFLIVFLSGCGTFSFNSAENLIRPPKLTGDDGELQAAFEDALSDKGEYILKYPSGGNYHSAFVKYDCDGDESEEAFVFYTLKSEDMNVYMHMLDKSDGKWESAGEVRGDGNDIYSIDFHDINNDGICEVFVGWNMLDSKTNKKLTVYASTEADMIDYIAVAMETYTDMYVLDFDGDGEKELFTALINSTSDTYTTEGRLLKMTTENDRDFKMTSVGQVSLYSEITAILGINSAVSGDMQYIYIDEAAGDSYLTELVYWDNKNNTLVLPMKVDMISVVNNPTSRHFPLRCTDIDNDGELEIPATTVLHDSNVVKKVQEDNEDLPGALASAVPVDNIYIISWQKFADGEFTVLDSYINNPYDGFKITYDSEKMKDIKTVFYADENLSQFSAIIRNDDPEVSDEAVLLFSIKTADSAENIADGGTILSNGKKVYIYEITKEGEEYGITGEYIKSIFALTEGHDIL